MRSLIRSAIFTLALITVGPSEAATLESQRDGSTDALNISTPVTYGTGSPPVFWQEEVSKLGSKYIRLHFNITAYPPNTDVKIEIRSLNGAALLYPASFIKTHPKFWSGIIAGDYALVSLLANSSPDGFGMQIDEIAYQRNSGTRSSTWGGVDEKKQVNDATVSQLVHDHESPVAWLAFQDGGVPRICTGFLISASKIMTNQHCIKNQETCDTLVAVFGYEFRADHRLDFGEQYPCVHFSDSLSNFDLDYSILELDGNPGNKWGELTLSDSEPASQESLVIIQHPAGEPKQVSEINCGALSVPVDGRGAGTDFSHSCDTLSGSSGSPVIDSSGQVVGIHHYGFAEGQVNDWTENRAVRMSLIRKKLNGAL